MGGDIGKGIGDMVVAFAILAALSVPAALGACVAVFVLLFGGSKAAALLVLGIGLAVGIVARAWVKRQA